MILVTAAAGRTGRHIVAALNARGLSTRIFVLPSEASGAPKADETFVGDMLNKADLAKACKDVEAVIHTGPMGADEPVMGQWVVDAARAAGVPHFVYISVVHPQIEWLLNHQHKLRVENYLINYGVPYTILQPMHYMQNIDVRTVVERGAYSEPYSADVRLSFLDMADLAEAAAKVVTDAAHYYATYEICGSDALNSREIAAILSSCSGKPVCPGEIPLKEFFAKLPPLDPYFRDFLVRLFVYYNERGFRGNPNVLGWLLGRSPTTFRQYVERMLSQT